MTIKSKKRKISTAWFHDHINDPYVKQAQKDGYRARAAYKLKEIDEQFKLLKPGQLVVDLGATPGAWSQYVRRKFRTADSDSRIVALDVLDLEPIDGVQFIQGDFREDSVVEQLVSTLNGRLVDVVLSDMAPNLSGIESSDSARIAHLVELTIEFAQKHMRADGAVICKVFHGSGHSQLVKLFKDSFRVVKPVKPKASRDRSSETFLVGIGLKDRKNPVISGDVDS